MTFDAANPFRWLSATGTQAIESAAMAWNRYRSDPAAFVADAAVTPRPPIDPNEVLNSIHSTGSLSRRLASIALLGQIAPETALSDLIELVLADCDNVTLGFALLTLGQITKEPPYRAIAEAKLAEAFAAHGVHPLVVHPELVSEWLWRISDIADRAGGLLDDHGPHQKFRH